MSFYEYCKKIEKYNTEGEISDFIKDLKQDNQFPKRIKSRDELESYLMIRGACSEAKRIGDILMMLYLTDRSISQ